jgi:hypothetical protein
MIAALAACTLTSACAALPPVAYNYFPSKGAVTIALTQTIDCTTDRTALMVTQTAPTVTVQYAGDHSQAPWSLPLAVGSSQVADKDMTIGFYDDGRLKSINASATGQGEALLTNIASFATAAMAAAAAKAPPGGAAPVKLDECQTVADWGNAKPVTVTYAAAFELLASAGKRLQIQPTPDVKPLFDKLNAHGRLGLPEAVFTKTAQTLAPVAFTARPGHDADNIDLKLQVIQPMQLDIQTNRVSIWKADVLAPTLQSYIVPIAKDAWFGKSVFVLALAESGAVTSIEYTRNTGASGPVNGAAALAKAAAPTSTADQLAELKAKDDLIVEQQRHATCLAHPDQCQ